MNCHFADEFCQDIDLAGIHIIENDRRTIENERQKIWSNARKALVEALAAEDRKQVSWQFCGSMDEKVRFLFLLVGS